MPLPTDPTYIPWYRTLTRLQWSILLIAWCGWVFDIMDTALFNFAKGPMLTEMLGGPTAYKLNGPVIEGRIQTVFLIGWALGGLFFGLLADRWGRTRTLVITVLMYCGLTGLTALCRTPEQVVIARFLTALGIGGEWAAGAALVAESLPDRARISASALLQSAAAFGPWFAAFANLGLAGQSWRWLFVVGIAPAALTVFIRSRTHEPVSRRASSGFAEPLALLFADPKLRRNVLVAMGLGVVGIAGAGTAPFWLPNLVKAASVGMLPAEVAARTSYATLTLHVGTFQSCSRREFGRRERALRTTWDELSRRRYRFLRALLLVTSMETWWPECFLPVESMCLDCW